MEKDLPPKGVWSNTVNTILEDILTSVAFAEKATIVNVILSYIQESTRGVVFLVNFAVKCFKPSNENVIMNQNTPAFTGSTARSVEKDLMRSLYI